MAGTQPTGDGAALDDIEGGGMAMAALTELSTPFADAHEARWSAGPSLPAIEWGA